MNESTTKHIDKASNCSVDGSTSFQSMRGNRPARGYDGSGSAARFFYCAKASKKERGKDNKHPTVKPLALMRYLVKLVTREGQIVIDPFAGSGSTLIACQQIKRNFIGIEIGSDYCRIIKERLKVYSRRPRC